jgi:hypothetical protein
MVSKSTHPKGFSYAAPPSTCKRVNVHQFTLGFHKLVVV